jgi:hypothetical protein
MARRAGLPLQSMRYFSLDMIGEAPLSSSAWIAMSTALGSLITTPSLRCP